MPSVTNIYVFPWELCRTHWSQQTTRWAWSQHYCSISGHWSAPASVVTGHNINMMYCRVSHVPVSCPMCCDHRGPMMITMTTLFLTPAPSSSRSSITDSVTRWQSRWPQDGYQPIRGQRTLAMTNKRPRLEIVCHTSSSDQHSMFDMNIGLCLKSGELCNTED